METVLNQIETEGGIWVIKGSRSLIRGYVGVYRGFSSKMEITLLCRVHRLGLMIKTDPPSPNEDSYCGILQCVNSQL